MGHLVAKSKLVDRCCRIAATDDRGRFGVCQCFCNCDCTLCGVGFSNTPIGPFHTTVLADFTVSAYSFAVSGPMSSPIVSAGIASTDTFCTSIGASIGSGKDAATAASTGRSSFLAKLRRLLYHLTTII